MTVNGGLKFASVTNSGVVTNSYLPPIDTGDATTVTLTPTERGVLAILSGGVSMTGIVVDSDLNVIAQPFTLGSGSPGALPSSTTAPFVAWRETNSAANVFTRRLEWLPAPTRIRVTQR
jgi:hypothetical protein